MPEVSSQPRGPRRALNAFWEILPQIVVSLVAAVSIVVVNLWLGHRDLVHDVRSLRVSVAVLDKVVEKQNAIMRYAVAHEATAAVWISRIVELERRVYNMQTNPQARPRAFTADDGAGLQKQIDALKDRIDSS